jgi:acetylornithine deacetylase
MKHDTVIPELHADAIDLLKDLIRTPSLSREETETADIIQQFFSERGLAPRRLQNNVWCGPESPDPDLPTVLLNSHHDTVPASSGYTRSPHDPAVVDGRLYGLGSNDAGGPLVALIAAYLYVERAGTTLANLILAATAEEEISGANGVALLLPELGRIDFGVVGEPTSLRVATAERGLMVLDCVAHGRSGHAARHEGENAIYRALPDIDWFRQYRFEPVSPILGDVTMAVTVIDAGSSHNVVPDRCTFTVDVRTTETWRNQDVLEVVRQHVSCDVTPRSMRSNASGIPSDHPLVVAAEELGFETYGSPTISDQAFMDFPTVKCGPGDSARSHTPDEWIEVEQIRSGIEHYVTLIEKAVEEWHHRR